MSLLYAIGIPILAIGFAVGVVYSSRFLGAIFNHGLEEEPEPEPKRKVYIKHHVNQKHQPVLTTCAITEPNGDQAFGIAMCSKLDNFNGKIGKAIAVGRALRALKLHSHCRPIARQEAKDILKDAAFHHITYKCEFVPGEGRM